MTHFGSSDTHHYYGTLFLERFIVILENISSRKTLFPLETFKFLMGYESVDELMLSDAMLDMMLSYTKETGEPAVFCVEEGMQVTALPISSLL